MSWTSKVQTMRANENTYSIDAERAVIGCCILDRECLIYIMGRLYDDMFYHPPHKLIFKAMGELHRDGKSVDFITLVELLDSHNKLSLSGGADYIIGLISTIPSVNSARHYSQIVTEKAQIRRVMRLGSFMTDYPNTAQGDLKTNLSDYLGELQAIATSAEVKQITKSAFEGLVERDIFWEDVRSGKRKPPMTFGLSVIDKHILLYEGNIMILAGRTGTGKTAFAQEMALKGVANGYPVLFITLEMTHTEMSSRIASRITEYGLTSIRRGDVYKGTENPHQRLSDDSRASRVREMGDNFLISCMAGSNERDIELEIQKQKLRNPNISLVIIDYIQLVNSSRGRSQYEKTTHVSKSLKIMAQKLEVPMVILSQFSRDAKDKRKQVFNQRPTIGDLKESGSIENDADFIMLMNLEAIEGPMKYMHLGIPKNRHGEQAEEFVAFQGYNMQFIESDSMEVGQLVAERIRAEKESKKDGRI